MTEYVAKKIKNGGRNLLFQIALLLLCLVLLSVIIYIKSETATEFWGSPLIFIYTVFVTTFQLSRVIGAILFKSSLSSVTEHLPKKGRDYEPTVSFVIPCLNEQDAIAFTIDKCYEVNYPKEKVEVIVINDGSTDNTAKVLEDSAKKHPSLIVINWKENKGKRHGMAEGFKRAKGEIVIQLDSDSYIEPETFRGIVEPFANPEIGAVCAHADPVNADTNILTKMQAAYYFMAFRVLKAAESAFWVVFCCSGCSSAYRRSLVLPIMDTWLNEKFLGLPITWGDDRALTNWVLRLGSYTVYTDRAQAFTIVPDKFKKFLKQQVRWKKGWFVNSVFASKFIWKRNPFVAFTYFYPLLFLTIATPFMAVRALIYNPLVRNMSPAYYILGIILVACVIVAYYRFISPNNKYWAYLFAWSGINMVVLSFILFYALATIQNRKWSTR